MAQHVHEVEDHSGEVAVADLVEILDQLPAGRDVGDLVVAPLAGESPPVQLRSEQLGLVGVLGALGLFVLPPLGVDLRDAGRRHAGEQGIARVLGGGGQEAPVHPLGLNLPVLREHRAEGPPLVVPEVVDDHHQGLLPLVEQGPHGFRHDLGGQQGVLVPVAPVEVGQPIPVSVRHESGELAARILLLHAQHLGHAGVPGGRQFKVPVDESLVDVLPILPP